MARYTDPVPEVARPPLVARVEEAVRRLAEKEGKMVPSVEPRLEAALRLLGTRPNRGRPPATDVNAQALWLMGIVEPLPYLLVLTVTHGGEADMLAHVEKSVPRLLAEGSYRRVAASVSTLAPGRMELLLALQESYIDLDPVPRQLDAGATVTIAGKLLPPFSRAELFATGPAGAVTRAPVTANGDRFAGPFKCATAGRHQIEVVAEGKFGSTVLANFPVYCGAPAPKALSISDESGREWKDAADAEARVLELLNQDRAAAGLKPLVADARLAQVARAHSEDMLGNKFVGHTSPTTGSPSDRTKKAGIEATRILLENVAVGGSPEQVERSFLGSPAHRANLLNKDVDRVGVGAAVLGQGDARELYVTQLFARFATPTDAKTATTQLKARVAASRALARTTVLVEDPDLEKVAGEIADGLAAGTLTPETSEGPVQKAAGQLGRRFAALRTMIASAGDVADVNLPIAVQDPELTHAGLAARLGKQEGATVIYCVMLLATARPAAPASKPGAPKPADPKPAPAK